MCNLVITTLNTTIGTEAKEMSEFNLHKAVILGENAGYKKGAGILYPLCMKSGCSHCYTGHERDTAQGRLCRKTKTTRPWPEMITGKSEI